MDQYQSLFRRQPAAEAKNLGAYYAEGVGQFAKAAMFQRTPSELLFLSDLIPV
jgi:hypothetical protein